MIHLNRPGTYLAMLFLATVITFTSCSTTGMQRSEEVQSTMKTVDNNIKKTIVQLDAIGASLDELTKPGQADVKRAFELYSKNVSKIKDMQKDFDKHADEMKESGKEYFSEWDKKDKKYDNPEIQKRSNERRAALGNIYDKIAENSVGVKKAFKTYVSDVNQIQAYMSNDLTTKGIASIASLSDQTVRNGNYLKNELVNLQSAIEDARSEMTQSGISMNE
ncbi:MAG: hypothetical protein U5K72_13990 [Balneolaceae bacterium]|nr:hypothetical protein [Balneolaceae bacterium]